ncbi:MAG TPA: hypothetical protein VHZ04_03350 [Candidatus Paceibacterota bacterium]|jgi:hypothetical protein|nr:hypothetical protein [Candidatus Paceibacterota bacterium]
MKSNFRKQLWLSGGVVVAAIVLATVGLYIFSGDIATNAQKIVEDKNLIADQNAALGVLATLEASAPKAATYLTAMQTLLPTHDALIGFSTWLAGIAQTDNVTASFSFTGNNAPPTASTPGTDSFTLGVDGSAAAIASFLQDIEFNAPGFLLSVDSFSLTSQGTNYHLAAQGKVFSQ